RRRIARGLQRSRADHPEWRREHAARAVDRAAAAPRAARLRRSPGRRRGAQERGGRGGRDLAHGGGAARAGRTDRCPPGKRQTRAQHAASEAQGYLAPLDAFEPGEASAWRRQLHHALARSDGRADTALRNKPHLLLRWIAELVRDARVVDAVEDLLGPDLL